MRRRNDDSDEDDATDTASILLVFVLGLLCDTVATDIIVDRSPVRYGAVAIVFWGKAGWGGGRLQLVRVFTIENPWQVTISLTRFGPARKGFG